MTETVTETRGLARDSAAVSVGTSLSRITGLVRILVISGIFGATVLGDMFLAVNALPQTVFATFGGHALSSMLVPVFVRTFARNPDRARYLGRSTLTVVIIVLGTVSVLGMALYRPIAAALASGIENAEGGGAADIAAVLVLVMAPQIVLYGVVSVLVGLQHARGHFFLPSIAPTIENVALVGGLVVLAQVFDDIHLTESDDTNVLVALALASTLALLLHVIVQAWGALRAGVSIGLTRPALEPEVRELGGPLRDSLAWTLLYGARLIGLIIAAGYAGVGAIQAIEIAYLAANLPTALIGFPVAAAIMPRLSRRRSGSRSIAADYGRARDLVVVVLIPMGAAYLFLSGPVSEVFAVGRFGTGDGPALLRAALAGLGISALSEAVYEVARQASLAHGDLRGFRRSIWVRGVVSAGGMASALVLFEGPRLLFCLGLAVSIGDVVALVAIDTPLRRLARSAGSLVRSVARAVAATAVAGVASLIVAALLDDTNAYLRLISAGLVYAIVLLGALLAIDGRDRAFRNSFDTLQQIGADKPTHRRTELRPATVDDLGAIVELHCSTFGNRDHTVEQIAEWYDQMLFSVLSDTRTDAIVADGDAGISGMVMRSPLTLTIDGSPIDAAVMSMLATDRESAHPTLAGRLIQACRDGDQEITLADRITPFARRVGERHASAFYPEYSLRWGRVIHPQRAVRAALLDRSPAAGPVRRGAVTALSTAGALAPRKLRDMVTLPELRSGLSSDAASADTLAEASAHLLDRYRLTPQLGSSEAITRRWDRVARRRTEGEHIHRIVHSRSGEVVGWYWMHRWPTGTGEVLDLIAAPSLEAEVIARMLHDAAELRIGTVQGRAHPSMLLGLGECGATFHGRSSAFGIHSERGDVHDAFVTGQALVGAVEGEYPLLLPRGE
ncbi:MAG: lipid II flippase MurJ [Actinomycetota bacterium]